MMKVEKVIGIVFRFVRRGNIINGEAAATRATSEHEKFAHKDVSA